MRIIPEEKKLYELLSGNLQYEIPMYQRNYDWKAENVTAFLDDLKIAMEQKEEHFFGSIVLIPADQDSDVVQVIDGQQRLTTFFVLISIIRDQISKFEDPKLNRNGKVTNLDSTTSTLLQTDDSADFRFNANKRIREIFDRYVLTDPSALGRVVLVRNGAGMNSDDKSDTISLRRNYFIIQDWLQALLAPYAGDDEALKIKIFQLLSTIRNSSKVLRIEVGNEDDAFLLFETMNDRGLRLTPSDLLKSYTLRKLNAADASISMDAALDNWDDAVESLDGYPFTKFLRHFLLSVQSQEKVQVAKIFAMFKKRISNFGHGGALRNLHELAEGAKDYSSLLGEGSTDDNQLNLVLARLNLLSETHRILLLRAMHFRFSHDQIRKLANAIEVLAFRWIITGGNAQQIESFYQKTAGMLNSDNPSEMAAVIKEVIDQSPTDDAVHAAIVQNPASRVADLQFYVLQRVNFGLTNNDLIWARKKIHIEHLAPQRPAHQSWFERVAPKKSDNPNEKVYGDFVGQWGNLTLLEYSINIPIGNAEWEVKVPGRDGSVGLDHSQIAMTRNLVDLPLWSGTHIADRTRWIADCMVRMTSLENYHNPGKLDDFR